jgi:hypothetical protein
MKEYNATIVSMGQLRELVTYSSLQSDGHLRSSQPKGPVDERLLLGQKM